MRVVKYCSYLLLFVLYCGNTAYSAVQHPLHVRSGQGVEQQYFAAIFNNINIDGVDEDGFADLIDDDNSTEVNKYNDGKDLPKKDSFQPIWTIGLSPQFIAGQRFTTATTRSPLTLRGSSSPLYITNRVIRI